MDDKRVLSLERLGNPPKPMRQFEWSDLRYFLELVRTGSPSSAGRRLKADHTTVRRRIAALETTLKARLFATRGAVYELTPEGDRLLKYAEAVETLALRAEEEIGDSDLSVSGVVRVGTPDGLGALYLARKLAELGAANPQLQIQLVVLPRIVNLSNREADLAIGLSPPGQHRQIVRRLTDFRIGLYGGEGYLDNGPPLNTLDDLAEHRFVGYVPELLYAPELDILPELGVGGGGAFESTNIMAQIEATAAGAGLCVLPHFMAGEDKRLRHVLADEFSVTRQFWLVIHPEMVNLARVRLVIDYLTESVRRDRRMFMAETPQAALSASEGADA